MFTAGAARTAALPARHHSVADRLASPAVRRVALALLACLSHAPAQDPAPGSDGAPLTAFVERHCARCHGGDEPEAGLDLVRLAAQPPRPDDAADWLELRDALRDGTMPPRDEAQPTADERARALAALEPRLAVLAAALQGDPGRVTMRRLSRVEYANTVRDLCGVHVDLAGFPADDLAYGFDNNGDALTLSPLHLEKYAALAEAIAAQALPDPDPSPPPTLRIDAEQMDCTIEGAVRSDQVALYTRGTAWRTLALPRAGRYRVGVVAWATQSGDEAARLELQVDDATQAKFEVLAPDSAPGVFAAELALPASLRLGAAFVNDHWEPKHPDPERRDRNVYVLRFEVTGPLDAREPSPAERWLAPFEPQRGTAYARARGVVREMLRRTWRRAPRQREVDRLAKLVADAEKSGETFRGGLRLALASALVSPSFLFRVEPRGKPASTQLALDGDAIAVRLAYYLWSSMPDEVLFARAREGALGNPSTLLAECERMLADPRAEALATNFAAQWLELRKLDALAPDPERFPGFTPELARAFRRETELLVLDVLQARRPVRELLLAEHSFLDATLAAHYGLDLAAAPTEGFARVELAGRRLGGLLGHGSILALTSHPTRSSPVRRGRFVLDQLLDEPPPPPAPGADSFPPDAALDTPADLRAQLARHREDPRCAVCHDRIDPLGLALEGFDPLGRRREGAIDESGTLPDGRAIAGAGGLRELLAEGRAFPRAVLHKLFVFALGRELRPADAMALDAALVRLPAQPTLHDLVLVIPTLDAFLRRSPPSSESR